MDDEGGKFNLIFRFGVIPMTLFSGSFFPIDQLPWTVRWLAIISPLWHGNELARDARPGHRQSGWRSPATWPTCWCCCSSGSGCPASTSRGGWSYERAWRSWFARTSASPNEHPDEHDLAHRRRRAARRAAAPDPPAAPVRRSLPGDHRAVLPGLPDDLVDRPLRLLRAGVLPARAWATGSARWSARSRARTARSATRPSSRPACWPRRR